MYAIVESGGKQYKVAVGDVLQVERLKGMVGDKVTLPVVFKSDGQNIFTDKGEATAEIVAHGKAKKIIVFKYKPKKNQRKKQGHRQQFSKIKILSI